MSTIATLTSGESGAASLTDINNNCSNLNTDKQEKGSGVTGNIPTFGASNVLGDSGKAVPAGTIVGTTDTQALTNKTISGATPTELGYVAGVTSAIQTQINAKEPSITTLAVTKGGTNVATLAAHGVVIGNGASAVNVTGAGTSGQVLTSNGAAADPTFQASAGTYKNGTTSYDVSTASGNQTIAHGLGVTPKYIRITVMYAPTTSAVSTSHGVYNGTTNSAVYSLSNNGSATIGAAGIVARADGQSSNTQTATATVDATNITLAWTKTNSPTGTAQILWEAFA